MDIVKFQPSLKVCTFPNTPVLALLYLKINNNPSKLFNISSYLDFINHPQNIFHN